MLLAEITRINDWFAVRIAAVQAQCTSTFGVRQNSENAKREHYTVPLFGGFFHGSCIHLDKYIHPEVGTLPSEGTALHPLLVEKACYILRADC